MALPTYASPAGACLALHLPRDLRADLPVPDRADPDRDPAVVQRRALFHLHREDADLRPRGLHPALVRHAADPRACRRPRRRATARGGRRCGSNATWVQAAKNSIWSGFWATILATVLGTLAALGLSRPEMPYRRLIMALLISPDDRADHHHRDGDVLLLLQRLRAPDGHRRDRGAVRAADQQLYLGVIVAHATLGIPFVIITVTATLSGFRPVADPGRRTRWGPIRGRPSSRSSCR